MERLWWDAGDLKILIGLFLCEFGAHLQREGERGDGGREIETESD